VVPQTDVFVLTPICPQNAAIRPMVLSNKTEIELLVEYHHSPVTLTADGQEEYSLNDGDIVRIGKSDQSAYFLRSPDSNYLKTLKQKLFS